jgi:hypothetical protein
VLIEDHLERDWPVLRGYMRLRDLETSDRDTISLTKENCREIRAQLNERRTLVRRSFLRLGITPLMLTTETSPRRALMEYFLRRKKHHR